MNQIVNEGELATRKRLRDDFPFYASTSLKIRTKEGSVGPLVLNKAQLHIHTQLEEQRKRTGRVRAMILKGRQQGASTYIEGRFIWKTTHTLGIRAYILTHEDDATKNLFGMARRYYEHLPPFIKPHASTENAKELLFEDIDSGYQVGTAGNKATGRSQTNQLFHGSEVAFWKNAAEHAKGVIQTVPDLPDTEVILESTGKGMGNYYHQQWKLAEAGLSEYIAIFVPWYWQDEYRKEIPDGFIKTDEEQELHEYYGLDDEQLVWRRSKIIELAADGTDGLRAFRQEYPCTAAEAFQLSGRTGLIKPDVVMKARNNTVAASGAFVVGVDPSRGGDRFATVNRMGRKAWHLQNFTGDSVDTLGKAVAKCKKLLDTVDEVAGKKPDMMFIDAGGGAEIVDRLHELGYDERVKAIAFGSTPLNMDRYPNKRCEIWGEMNLWLSDENLDVEIPNDDQIHADLCASPYDRDSHDRMVLWKKERIIKEYGFSPDDGDALGLTFAEPVDLTKSKPLNFKQWN